MCQNLVSESNEQINRCLEQGMPNKIGKLIMYKIKKNVKKENKNQALRTVEIPTTTNTILSKVAEEMKEPQTSKIHEKNVVENVPIVDTNIIKIPKMCDQMQQQLLKSKMKKPEIESPYTDVLSVGTAYTKIICDQITRKVEKFRQSKIYDLLTKTAQPAHFIAICILSAVLIAIWPELTESVENEQVTTKATKTNTLAAIAYLGAFATHFGAQIWMTFVSGLSLYFSLPRHTFGQCQQILFPKYFALNASLSIILLILFVKCFLHTCSLAITVQLVTLALNPVIELVVRLYLAPPMLRLMHIKYKIEDAVGSGQEVGSIAQGDLSECPHYQCIHKAFRKLHMAVAICNMATLLNSFLQLYFLASKIQIEIS